MNWLKSNKAATGFLASGAVLLAVMAGIQGCEISDLVKVKVPPNIQRVTGSAPIVTLTDAPAIRADAITLQTRAIAQFDESIQRGQMWGDFLAAGLNLGLTAGEGALAGVPGGGLLVSLLFGAGGLMMRKPGDGKTIKTLEGDLLGQATAALEKLAKEKRASYNKGVKVGSGTGGGA
jgi:hypothetical protein